MISAAREHHRHSKRSGFVMLFSREGFRRISVFADAFYGESRSLSAVDRPPSNRSRELETTPMKLNERLRTRCGVASLVFDYRSWPNQALQPTRMLVTIRAYARLAPSTRVADL